ncbi:MAG TPA: exonuclease domain-containing protein [Kofleriaceae bacterium]|nr:exonuclease domain-containing protein [Kofleriaceae bacterium]
MEGTLSLFDWRPASEAAMESVPARLVPSLAEGSGPCEQVPEAGEATSAKRAPRTRKLKSVPKAEARAEPMVEARAEPTVEAKAEPKAEASPISPSPIAPSPIAPSPASDEPSEPACVVRDDATLPLPLDLGPQVTRAAQLEAPAATEPAIPVATLAVAAAGASRIVIFDCETTGTDRLQDQVIELCVQRGLGDDAPSQTWRIKPSVAIHPGAQAVHGITPAELEGAPPFAQLADEIAGVFAETDVIVGYNIAFDIDMLQAEYTRIGRPLLDLNGKKIVDAFRLWQQCEPRSLQHAHQRFVGAGFASAHSASADVAATGRVLTGMLRMFNLTDHDWEAIACKCDPQYAARASWVGPSRHLRWEDGVIVLGFGKHTNAPLHQLAAGPDRSFLRWVVERDFPVHVGEVCRAALDLGGEEFLAWARRKYPCPIVPAPTAAL